MNARVNARTRTVRPAAPLAHLPVQAEPSDGPLTSEPPLADTAHAPLTSEPPLTDEAPLTSEPTTPAAAAAAGD
ncbi:MULTISPECIES: hypothetical protein [unclassified Streptomyces]|uniref:hypothetical protein n=1 Tax=unclassified Streptomyces TaxID=2593676 RepID=UPI001BE7F5F2|nr:MULTISPECIES: hypothetical protein [unclassified Streptomyces]MBT2404873.1 hypothetical protein [Streptomyces sp. ISL-21]MBT2456282.1 hypothetical protein [Streptomyces sp. ISL-86]